MTGADQGKRSFADKLSYLIETVHPPDRDSYSYRFRVGQLLERARRYKPRKAS